VFLIQVLSCIVNRQFGVGDSKYVAISDPYPQVYIFNIYIHCFRTVVEIPCSEKSASLKLGILDYVFLNDTLNA